MSQKIQLVYFGLHGRAEPSRLMLAHSGTEWQDVVKTGESWAEFKKVCPGGQMPTLIMPDGTMMGQSMSIVRFIGRKFGYYPEDAKAAYFVDAAVDTVTDHFMAVMKAGFMEPGEAKDAEVVKAFESAEKMIVKLEVFLECIYNIPVKLFRT